MDRTKLKKLIESKKERNRHLEVQYKYLSLLEEELAKTRIRRFFGTSYLIIKRFLLILSSCILIIGGVIMYLNPSLVSEFTQIDEYLIEETQKLYHEKAGETLSESIIKFSKTESQLSLDTILKSLNFGIQKTILKEVTQIITDLLITLIILGVLLLYISRQTKKIRIRNKQISNAEEKIEKVLTEFRTIIASEENELQNLEDIYNHRIVGTSASDNTNKS